MGSNLFFLPLFIKKESQIGTFVTLGSDGRPICFVVTIQLKTLRIK